MTKKDLSLTAIKGDSSRLFFFERGSQMGGSSLTRGVIRISLFSFLSFFARGTMLRHSMEEKKGKEKSVCVFWRLAKGIRREGGPFP